MARIPRICRLCLFYEGMPFRLEASTLGPRRVRDFAIDDDGVCTVCREYAKTDGTSLEARREAFDAAVDGDDPVVMGLSGGKDSLSTLYILRERLGLRVEVVFYDNGFLLPHVAPQVRDVCRRLDVELHELGPTPEARERLARMVDNPMEAGIPPCHECSGAFVAELVKLARTIGARSAIFGANHFLSWPDAGPPRGVAVTESSPPIAFVSLPYLLGVTREQTMENVRSLGATVKSSPAGLSTNCRVPELVQARIGAALGHVPELEMLSLEVLVGHIPREVAAAELVDRVRNGNLAQTAWIVEAFSTVARSSPPAATRTPAMAGAGA